MKFACVCLPFVVFAAGTATAEVNPLSQVLALVDDLAAKIAKDAEAEAKAYNRYFEWCDETSQNGAFAIKTASTQRDRLQASIGELTSDISISTSKIDELVASVASSGGELKRATAIRAKEAADFVASEKELVDGLSTLGRAIGILSKEMAKSPASFAQLETNNMAKALQGLSAVFDAAAFNSRDQSAILALVQSQQGDEADGEDVGAPAAKVYGSQSGGIVDVLEDMKEKAEEQLSELRKAEVNMRHNFAMLEQSLEDEGAAGTKDMEDEKTGRAAAEEARASAQADLDIAVKEVASSSDQLATARSTCLQTAADHEATVAARKEELGIIAQAKRILQDNTSGAESQTYSLLQVSSLKMRSHRDLVRLEVVTVVKRLAKQHHSLELSQLASHIAAMARYGGGDSFAKIRGLIQNMIAKLEKEAGADATEKAYCDEQTAKTAAKQADLEEDVTRQTSRIDQAAAKSAQLKHEVQVLENELSNLAKEQAEMDNIRKESNAAYTVAKADLELGLGGVRKAIGVLQVYYSGSAAMLQGDSKFGEFMQQPAAPETHSKSTGAGGSIIDILEVVESDFASNLAKEETEEADAQSEYEMVSQQNTITKTSKEQSVKYKTSESSSLDKTAAEYSSDRDTTNAELAAVVEYSSRINDRCIAKPEAYAERTARREAEVSGLKEALRVLQEDTALVQRKRRSSSFLGTLAAH